VPDSTAYAARTKVPVGRSKAEIEQILARYGATGFGYMTQGGASIVMFEAHGRRIRFSLPAPQERDQVKYQAEERRLWRSLAMAIKSKLDIVRSGISTFEAEMLPYMMLPDGRTFAQWADDNAAKLDAGAMPPMLPGGKS
jgi:hypothetical protein